MHSSIPLRSAHRFEASPNDPALWKQTAWSNESALTLKFSNVPVTSLSRFSSEQEDKSVFDIWTLMESYFNRVCSTSFNLSSSRESNRKTDSGPTSSATFSAIALPIPLLAPVMSTNVFLFQYWEAIAILLCFLICFCWLWNIVFYTTWSV